MQFSDEEIENLSIDKFIFHVVHHRTDEPILLDETPIGDFEDFFLARAMETLRGNRFIFADGSIIRTLLKQVLQDDKEFVPVSKTLAQAFHAGRDKRIKPGVMILMQLTTGKRRLLSILKYDHEEAVTYDITDDAKAILKAIANSFTKSPDALQKSALIEILDDSDNIVVIDKTVRHEITDFFRGFLACKRLYDEGQMTKVVETVVVEVAKRHQDELPNDITQNVRDRYYDAVQKRENFDENDFFAEFFGSHGNANVRASFDKLLIKKGMQGEVFKFDKGAVKKRRPQKYKTAEGVKIEIPEQASDTFKNRKHRHGDRCNDHDQPFDQPMTLEEMIELGDLFRRLAGTNGATFSETATICRVDQIVGLPEDDLKRVMQLASTLAHSDMGSLEVYGDISGKVDHGREAISAIDGETVSIRLMKKSEQDGAYFLTHAGFQATLCQDQFILDVRKIWIADKFLSFATQKCVYAPWGTTLDPIAPAGIFDSPRRLVRDQSYELAPSDVGPWYLTIPGGERCAVFALWKEQAAKNLAFCLPTEIRSGDDGFQVVLKGARSSFANVNVGPSLAPMFDALNDAVRWVYDQRRDTETKFQLLNNHLALYWRDGDEWPLGLTEVLQNSLASAREAFAFHLQEDSKEAIKSLGDLRKALQDEVSRTQTATRDLLAALWRDAAIAGAAFALRTATANATMVNLIASSAAALLFASIVTTVFSNWRFDALTKDVREQWRKRLYAFMSAAQWKELVVQPISRARWVYRISIAPVSMVYIALILILLWMPYPAKIELFIEFIKGWAVSLYR